MGRGPALLILLAACGGGGGGTPPPPPVELSFDFELVRADLPTGRTVAIANPLAGEAFVELLAAPAAPFALPPDALPAVVAQGADLALPVTLTPVAPGETDSSSRLRFRNIPTGEEREVDLALQAEVEEPRLVLLTAALDFGSVRIGNDAVLSAGLRNVAALSPVAVSGLSVLPEEFSAAVSLPRTIEPGATFSFPLRYEPTALGERDFTLSVSHGAPHAPLDVAVTAQADTWVERIVFDFGSVPLTGEQTGWLEVDVPAHGISLSLEALGPDDATIAMSGLEGPDGTVYENAEFTGEFLQHPGSGVFTATLPNSDRALLQMVPGNGTYRFRFTILGGSASELQVRAIVLNRPGGVAFGGSLDLNVFLAPSLGIAAGEAPGDERVQGLLAEADRIFGQQGLALGAVDYYEIDDPAFDDITTDAEFGDLLELAATASEPRLNLFLVRTALGGGVLGVAARIAGPARNDTRASGVMVDFDYGSATTAGHVTAHELGHYLGLLHTVESTGDHDLIDDTVECPASGTSGACPTEGNGYLMHWRVLSVDPVITDGQALVILGHPLVDETSPLSLMTLREPLTPAGDLDDLPPNWCGCAGCVANGR